MVSRSLHKYKTNQILIYIIILVLHFANDVSSNIYEANHVSWKNWKCDFLYKFQLR